MRHRLTVAMFSCVLLVACGGGQATPPTSPNSPILSSTKTRIVLTIPPAQLQVHLRRPLYTSPNTLGIGINVGPTPTTFTPAQTQTPQIAIDLSPVSSACTAGAGGSRTCTLTLDAPPGTDDISLVTWDQSPVSGSFSGAHMLSSQTLASQNIVAGSTTALSLALNAIVSQVTMVPLPSQIHEQASGTGFAQVGNALISYNVYALDADGNIITGQGAPTLSLTSPDAKVLLSNGGTSTWTSRVVGYAPQPLVLTATPPNGSGLAPTTTPVPITAIPELWVTLYNGSSGAVQGYALYSAGPYPITSDIIHGITEPIGIATDNQGDFFISDYTNNVIDGYVVGSDGAISACLCDTAGNTLISGLALPTGVAYGSLASGGLSGSGIWFSECGAGDFQTAGLTPSGLTGVTSVVPTGVGAPQPVGVALDGHGNAWVANTGTNSVNAFTSLATVTLPASYSYTYPVSDVPLAIAFDPYDPSMTIWVSASVSGGGVLTALSYPIGSTPPSIVASQTLNFTAPNIPVSLAFDGSHHLWVGTDTGSGTDIVEYTVASGVAPAPTGTVITAGAKRRPAARRPQNWPPRFGTTGNQPNGILIVP